MKEIDHGIRGGFIVGIFRGYLSKAQSDRRKQALTSIEDLLFISPLRNVLVEMKIYPDIHKGLTIEIHS